MKLSRSLLGKIVRITWKDPRSARVKSHYPNTHQDIVRGRASLATWSEYGVVEDVTEGVLHLQQSLAIDPPLETDQQHEVILSIVPEELIEAIVVLTELGNPTIEGGRGDG